MKRKWIPMLLGAFVLVNTISASAAVYSDITGHPDEGYIAEYSSHGLVSGYPDGTFQPNANITRAEVTALVNQLELPQIKTTNTAFLDVPTHEWYYSTVSNAVKSGLVSGYEDNTFRPQKNITRFEAISIVSRLVESTDAASIQLPYGDRETIPAWVNGSVKNLYAEGIISEYSGNFINGNTPVTRAEMVRMLDKVMRSHDFDTEKITVRKSTATEDRGIQGGNKVVISMPHDILGYLTIQSIGMNKFPVKDGADLATIKTGIGHFSETPIWKGNVALCAHNRDYKYDFRNLKNIKKGDTITYETRFGTRTYKVTVIKPIEETDWSDIVTRDEQNKLTMVTCIESQPTKRLLVQAVQK